MVSFQYKVLKINVNEKEESVSQKFNQLGKEGWELVNFQPSTESHGVFKNIEPWTTCFCFVFKKLIK